MSKAPIEKVKQHVEKLEIHKHRDLRKLARRALESCQGSDTNEEIYRLIKKYWPDIYEEFT